MKFLGLIFMAFIVSFTPAVADNNRNNNSLITPTLWAEKPIYFACNITNLANKARIVRTRIINGTDGKVLLDKKMKLASRRTMDTTVEGLQKPGGPLYCDFTILGSKKKFRGVAKLWGGPNAANSSDITAIAAE